MKRLIALTAGLTATIVLANLPVFSAAADESSEPIPFEQLEWAGERLAMTLEAASRDSDGDGWSDWYERLEGTDPFDPSSHPTSLTVEIVDGTAFVQSFTFPDRLAVVDLQLPERAGRVEQVFGAVEAFVPGGVGDIRTALDAWLTDADMDLIGKVMAEATELMESVRPATFERQVSGISVSLISTVVAETLPNGDKKQTITDGPRTTEVIRDGFTGDVKEVTETYEDRSQYDPVEQTGTIWKTKKRNGEVIEITSETWAMGQPAGGTAWTPEGTAVVPPHLQQGNPPKKTATSTETTEKPTETTEKPTDTTKKPTDTTEKPTETTSGHVNPDADPILIPTAEQLAERAEFLRNVNARFGPRAPLVDPLLPSERPSVGDPEDPPCEDERCAWFFVLDAPRMDQTRGGCPPASCNSAGPQRP